jgi:hypothetical protein
MRRAKITLTGKTKTKPNSLMKTQWPNLILDRRILPSTLALFPTTATVKEKTINSNTIMMASTLRLGRILLWATQGVINELPTLIKSK